MEDTSSALPEPTPRVPSLPTRRSRHRSVFMFVIAPLIVVALLLALSLSPLGRGLLSTFSFTPHTSDHITPTIVPMVTSASGETTLSLVGWTRV